MLKKEFPDRKGSGMFKLSTLVTDVLADDHLLNSNDALFNVITLQKLIYKLEKEKSLLQFVTNLKNSLRGGGVSSLKIKYQD